MEYDVAHPGNGIADAGLLVLVFGSFEGPIVEQGTANDVFARHKPPIPRIEAVMAIVAHHEVVARRDDQVSVDDVVGLVDGPGFGGACILGGRRGGMVL